MEGEAASLSAENCMHGHMAKDTPALPWWLGMEASLSKERGE